MLALQSPLVRTTLPPSRTGGRTALRDAVTTERLLHGGIALRHLQQREASAVPDCFDVSSRRHEPICDGRVICAPGTPMHRSEGGPSQRGALMRRISGVERYAAALEEAFDHPHAAHPAGGMQGGPAVDTWSGRVESETEHEVGR